MEEKDLKQIGDIVEKGLNRFWESDVEPAFQGVAKTFEGVDKRFEAIDKRFERIEKQISQLPTKSYLDDKLAELEGGLISKLRKEDQKLERLVEMLKQKDVLTENEQKELAELKVFPK